MTLSAFEKTIFCIAASILVFFGFFYGLGSYGLFNNNEGLYAQIPIEMLENQNYIIPTLNGGPYLEKPPLLYWLIALCFKLFGVGETTARLIPALSGVSLVGATGVFLKKVDSEKSAAFAVLLFSSAMGFLIFSRMVYFDVLLTLFLSLSLFSFFLWHQTFQKRWIRWFYVFLAFAVLTKGFLAIALAFLTVVIFLFWMKVSREKWITFFDVTGLSLFLLVLLPWHVAAVTHEEGFAWFYFINEHVLRYLGLREPKDYYSGPLYYYIHRLFLYVMPWTVVLFFAPRRLLLPPLFKFFISWFLIFFLFFSFSKAKANYYIMTVFPPLIGIFAFYLSTLKWRKFSQGLVSFFVLLPSFGVLILFFGWIALPSKATSFIPPLSLFWISLWCLLSALSLGFVWGQQRSFLKILPLTLQSIPVTLLLLSAIQFQENELSAKQITEETLAHFPDKTLCLYRDYEKISSVLFYTKKPLLIADSLSNDLLYAERTRGSLAGFVRIDALKGEVLFFVYKERYGEFESRFPEAVQVFEKGPVRVYKNFFSK